MANTANAKQRGGILQAFDLPDKPKAVFLMKINPCTVKAGSSEQTGAGFQLIAGGIYDLCSVLLIT